ncbi:DUF6114 domain-containing protein [Kitasatospora sp. HPMI-4]|uniref:DUF6114 domain-containing protein n=1 Tax=Kitasatospora sp. HPMI-4 TaxID=3448443 RepID=UPI003F1D38EA
MTNTTTHDLSGPLGRAAGVRRRFRIWRGTRPFWAGALTISASAPIIYFPYTHLSLGGLPLALSTTAGAGALLIGILLIVLGVTLWLQQQSRVFAGAAAIVLSLVSVPVANFGGFLLGMLPGLVGGSLACAWSPPDEAWWAAEAPTLVERFAGSEAQSPGMASVNHAGGGHGGE